MIDEKKSWPLNWPVGYKRTEPRDRKDSQFRQSMVKAQSALHNEVDRLRATDLVVSTDLRYRADGLLYAAEMSRKNIDPGVAIYFNYKKKPVSMCCDQYKTVWENMYALAKGIEALRGMERWGVSEFLDRAFTGFTAIPERTGLSFWGILGLDPTKDTDVIKKAYYAEAKKNHPDQGGDPQIFGAIADAYRLALEYSEK